MRRGRAPWLLGDRCSCGERALSGMVTKTGGTCPGGGRLSGGHMYGGHLSGGGDYPDTGSRSPKSEIRIHWIIEKVYLVDSDQSCIANLHCKNHSAILLCWRSAEVCSLSTSSCSCMLVIVISNFFTVHQRGLDSVLQQTYLDLTRFLSDANITVIVRTIFQLYLNFSRTQMINFFRELLISEHVFSSHYCHLPANTQRCCNLRDRSRNYSLINEDTH